MLFFYRYVFYKIYSFFERLRSTNAYNTASMIMVVLVGVVILKLHLSISNLIFDRGLDSYNLFIPYSLLSILLYLINYFLLIRNLRYLKIEDLFIQKKYPIYFDRLFIALCIIIPILLII
jgi:hypothetical protein